MNCVLITEKNKGHFSGILPDNIRLNEGHLAFGAYDGEGYSLGTVAASYLDYECSIDWLYVIPEARRCGVATGLLECLKDAAREFWLCPITARFEAAAANHLYDCFISQEDMVRRKVGKSVVEMLKNCGALGSMPESSQVSLFDFGI